ncbi:unnamed protein product, partial [Gulo gulo]
MRALFLCPLPPGDASPPQATVALRNEADRWATSFLPSASAPLCLMKLVLGDALRQAGRGDRWVR